MSPVYRPDPTIVSAGFKIFDKGEYEFEVGEPKPFQGETTQGKNAGNINYGVRFSLIVVEGPEKNGRLIHNCMMMPESEGFSKQFQMAVYGYDKKDEKKFNEEIGSKKDWTFDPKPDDGSDPYCADGWRDMKGKRVKLSLDKVMGKDKNNQDQEQQKVTGMRPA